MPLSHLLTSLAAVWFTVKQYFPQVELVKQQLETPCYPAGGVGIYCPHKDCKTYGCVNNIVCVKNERNERKAEAFSNHENHGLLGKTRTGDYLSAKY